MKVQCEYCQNMVEVQPGVDKVCPFCGGPLPAELEGPSALRGLPLEELDLSGKPVYGSIDAVLEIPTLQVLKLNGAHSEGTDYTKFANLTQLRELDLGGLPGHGGHPAG